MMDQNHAYYEEIYTIPAAAVDMKSIFGEAGHWYLIHPLPQEKKPQLSIRVLNDLRKWIESSEHLYIGTSKQVELFHEKRAETLELVKKELSNRAGTLDNEEGYLGDWEDCSAVQDDPDMVV